MASPLEAPAYQPPAEGVLEEEPQELQPTPAPVPEEEPLPPVEPLPAPPPVETLPPAPPPVRAIAGEPDPAAPGFQRVQVLRAAGFSNTEIEEDTRTQMQMLLSAGFTPDEVAIHYGNRQRDDSDFKRMAGASGLEQAIQSVPELQDPTLWEAFELGLQSSVAGLMFREDIPEAALAEDPGFHLELAQGLGALLPDLPIMIGAGAFTAPAGPVVSMAAAFAAPGAMRQLLMDTYSKGQVQNLDEFQERLGDTLIAMGKEGTIGAATGGAGKLARVGLGKPLERMAASIPGKLGGSTAGITEAAAAGSEVVAMVGAGGAVHGEVPEAKDFALAAITIGLLRAGHKGVTATRQGAGRVMQQRANARENARLSAKFRRIYVRTGLNPREVVEAARRDPTIIEDLSSVNIVVPRALQTQVEGVDPQLVRAAEIVAGRGEAKASTLTKEMPDLSRADADALLGELEQAGVIGPRPPLFAGDRRVNATSEKQAREMVKPAIELERATEAGGETYFRADSTNTQQRGGLIPLTTDRSVAEGYATAGEGAVAAYTVEVKNPLDMSRDSQVVAGLDAEGDPWAEAIINHAREEGSFYFWYMTKPVPYGEAWSEILIPQLRRLGYDGLRYVDDPQTGPVLAVFGREQMKPATEPVPSERAPDLALERSGEAARAEAPTEPWQMTREEWLGEPTITKASNAKDLRARGGKTVEDFDPEPFMEKYSIYRGQKKGSSRYVVTDGETPIATYDGETLVVDKPYRKQGIATALIEDFRTNNLDIPPARERTKAAQALQKSVHRNIVTRAVDEGKPVPPEVLADYPRLISKAEANATGPELDYRGLHTAPGAEHGAPMHEMDRMYPDDIYSPNGAQYYGDGGPSVARDKAVQRLLVEVRGNPDAEVTVYRGVPEGTGGEIRSGDWVTPDRQYAEDHAARYGEGEIQEMTVRAGDLYTEGNSLYEFGWEPRAEAPAVAEAREAVEAIKRMKVAELREAGLMPEKGGRKRDLLEEAEKRLGLVEEAQKFDTADEFIEAQGGIMYHGTAEEFGAFDLSKTADESIWFTSDRGAIDRGEVAASGAGRAEERVLRPGVKLASEDVADKLMDEQLIAKGYRGIAHEADDFGAWTRLFFPNEDTLTLRQIGDLFEQARQPRAEASAGVRGPLVFEKGSGYVENPKKFTVDDVVSDIDSTNRKGEAERAKDEDYDSTEDVIVLYHSGDKSIADDVHFGTEPNRGEWVREVLDGATDDQGAIDAIAREPAVTFLSDAPDWVVSKVARKLGKNDKDVTLEDVREHGHLAVFKVDADADVVRAIDPDSEGFTNATGRESYERWHETPLYSEGDVYTGEGRLSETPFGVERGDYFTTESVSPEYTLTGDGLVEFLQRKGVPLPEAPTPRPEATALAEPTVPVEEVPSREPPRPFEEESLPEQIADVRALILEAEARGEQQRVDLIGRLSALDERLQRETVEPGSGQPSQGGKDAMDVVLSHISVGEKPAKRGWSLSQFYTHWKDGNHPLRVLGKYMEGGKDTREAIENEYSLARLFQGTRGKADHFIQFSPFKFGTYERVGRPLVQILKPVRKNLDGIRSYMVASRRLELYERAKEKHSEEEMAAILEEVGDVPIAEARRVVEEFGPELAPIAAELYEYQNHVLQYARDGGLITPEAYAMMTELNKNYVPFFRVMLEEGAAGGAPSGNSFFRINVEGSGLKIHDPIESIIKNTHSILHAVERNAISDAYINHVEKVAGQKGIDVSDLATRVKPRMKKTRLGADEMKKLANKLRDGDKLTEDQRAALEQETLDIFRPDTLLPGQNQIVRFKDGERQVWEVPPEVAEVLQITSREEMNLLVKILSVPATTLRAGAVLSPRFMLANPVRDSIVSFIQSDSGYKAFADTLWGAAAVMGKTRLYQDWMRSGGAQSELVALDRVFRGSDVAGTLGGGSMLSSMRNVLRSPLEGLRVLSQMSEQMTRVGEFGRALHPEKGTLGLAKETGEDIAARLLGQEMPPREAAKGDIMEAGLRSRDVSLDFGRVGSRARAVNRLVAFLNASLEGTDKMLRTMKDHPTRTMLRGTALLTVPALILQATNQGEYGWSDPILDDEGNPTGRYKPSEHIPQWQRDMFFVFPTYAEDDDGNILLAPDGSGRPMTIWHRIPAGYGYGMIFKALPQRLWERIVNEDPHAFDDYMESLLASATVPFVAQAAIPFVETWANRSLFTGAPQIPAHLEGVLPEFQATPRTTSISRLIGGFLSDLPFGASQFDLPIVGQLERSPVASPMVIEDTVRALTGGLGTTILRQASRMLEDMGILPEPPGRMADTPSDVIGLGAFAVRTPSGGELSRKFWDRVKANDQVHRTVSLLMSQGRPLEAQKLMQKHAGSAYTASGAPIAVPGMVESIQKLTKMRAIFDLPIPGITPDERLAFDHQIKRIKLMLYRAGLDQFEAMSAMPTTPEEWVTPPLAPTEARVNP